MGIGLLAALILAGVWAFSSPPGSSPDDGAHLTTIWCAWGGHDGCRATSADGYFAVPAEVGSTPCFALDAGTDARCDAGETDGLVVGQSLRGYNPPVFYAVMRLFVSDEVAQSVLAMRTFNILLASLLWLFAFAVSPTAVRRSLVISWSALLIPIGLFFIPSTNPTSWSIISAGLFWAFLYAAVSNQVRSRGSRIGAWIGVGLTVLVGLGSRSDMLYVLGVLTLAVIAVGWQKKWATRGRWLALSGALALALVASLYLLSSRAGVLLRQFIDGVSFPSNSQADQPHALAKILLEVPTFLTAFLGAQGPVWSQRNSTQDVAVDGFAYLGFTYGAGYTDVQFPVAVPLLLTGSLAFLLFTVSKAWTRRQWLGALLVASGLLLEILAIRAAFEFGAENIQPRYFFPLFLGGMGLLLIWPNRLPNRVQSIALCVAGVVASSLALRALLSRYVHGQSHSYIELASGPHWWWNFGPSPHVVWVVGTAASIVVAAVLVSYAFRGQRRSLSSSSDIEPSNSEALPSAADACPKK